ncbi:MAG: nickel pincer cofactor biosynthesis protein LarB [Actinobacteria bacterium]|nr:nickel pincer cofactor biosynthesis protein LarB [Actinomycetota bacterium]
MNYEKLTELLKKFKEGELSEEEVVGAINKLLSYESIEIKIDGLRELRKGLPETVFCLRKTPKQAAKAFKKLYEINGRALATKASKEHFEEIKEEVSSARYFPASGVIIADEEEKERLGYVTVIGAGSSDYPVCEEAHLTLGFLGSESFLVLDVGVAGVHRLNSALEHIEKSNCLIVVAGMEGALPSLIAGFSPVPVIGVPTSVGYGVSFGGVAPLLAMLNSCAEGLSVVNIDNGFGAAVSAHLINMLAVKGGRS